MFGAPVSIHWTFLLLLFLQLLLAFIVYESLSVFWYELLLYGPMLFITVLFHELARAIISHRLGGAIDSIVLWPLGGLTVYGPENKGPTGDLKVSLAGPLSHLPIAGIFALIYTLIKEDGMQPLTSMKILLYDLESGFNGIFSTGCRTMFAFNMILFALHLLLPIYPLDAVRVWAGVLRGRMSLSTTAKIISLVGFLLSLAFFVFGCVKLFDRKIPGGVGEVLLGGFGMSSSKILYDLNKTGRLAEDPVFGRACYAEPRASIEVPGGETNQGQRPTTSGELA